MNPRALLQGAYEIAVKQGGNALTRAVYQAIHEWAWRKPCS